MGFLPFYLGRVSRLAIILYQDRNPLYQFNTADASHARRLEGKKKDGKGWEAGSAGRQYLLRKRDDLAPSPPLAPS